MPRTTAPAPVPGSRTRAPTSARARTNLARRRLLDDRPLPPTTREQIGSIQRATRVSSPGEPAEREAEATANRIMRMSGPEGAIQAVQRANGDVHRKAEDEEKIERKADDKDEKKIERKADDDKEKKIERKADDDKEKKVERKPEDEKKKKKEIERKPEEDEEKPIDRKAQGQPDASSNVTADIRARTSSGASLSTDARRFMEPRFGADFSGVRVHSDDHAARLNRQVSARAFTYGKHIFFGQGEYQPETSGGRTLLAHELTHTLQQGSTAQGGPVQRAFDLSLPGIDTALDYFADLADEIPGFRMLTLVLGMNPITMIEVERSTANILRAVVEFMPGGTLVTDALDLYGVFDSVGAFIDAQLLSLGLDGGTIERALLDFLGTLSPSSLLDLESVWNDAQRILTAPIDRMIAFVGALAGAVYDQIKAAMLLPLAALAAEIPGWDVLCAVLGRNPITGEVVPQTAETLIGGFMRLIGQEAIWEHIQEANAVERCLEWFQGALGGLLELVQAIPGRFYEALASLEITDIVLLPLAYVKVASAFGSFVLDFVVWGSNTIWDLLEIVFSVVAPEVMPYVAKAGDAFRTILNDPIGFGENLVDAGSLGLEQFVAEFPEHLKKSLLGWLTGSLASLGVYMPEALSLAELGKFALSMLGISWPRIRDKIVVALGPGGESTMQMLETSFDVVVALATGGLGAAWDLVAEQLSGLRRMVISSITSFVTENVVIAAVSKLVAMLIPGPAFIAAIVGIYDTVMFFVERFRQLEAVVAAFIDSIAAIASGAIDSAADRVEETMAGSLTLVISFLARIARLGNVTDYVIELIESLRAKVDGALDVAIAWIVEQARTLGAAVGSAAQGVVDAAVNWWTARSPVSIDGKNHTLSFQGKGSDADLYIESTPQSLTKFLKVVEAKKLSPRAKEALKEIRDRAEQIDKLKGKVEDDDGKKHTNVSKARGKQIEEHFKKIVALLPDVGLSKPPETKVEWTPKQQGPFTVPEKMHASVLSIDGGGFMGSSPTVEVPLWKAVNRRPKTYVQAHLLSHHVHGPGDRRNLVPTTGAFNTEMEREVEDIVKREVLGENNVVRYTVTVNYDEHPARVAIPEEKYLPTSMNFEIVLLRFGRIKNEQTLLNESRTHVLPPNALEGPIRATVDLSDEAATAEVILNSIAREPGYNPWSRQLYSFCRRIVAERTARKRKFHSWRNLRNLARGPLPDAFVDVLEADRKFVKLRSGGEKAGEEDQAP